MDVPLSPRSLAAGLPSPVPVAGRRVALRFRREYPERAGCQTATAAGLSARVSSGSSEHGQPRSGGLNVSPVPVGVGVKTSLGMSASRANLRRPLLVVERPGPNPRSLRTTGRRRARVGARRPRQVDGRQAPRQRDPSPAPRPPPANRRRSAGAGARRSRRRGVLVGRSTASREPDHAPVADGAAREQRAGGSTASAHAGTASATGMARAVQDDPQAPLPRRVRDHDGTVRAKFDRRGRGSARGSRPRNVAIGDQRRFDSVARARGPGTARDGAVRPGRTATGARPEQAGRAARGRGAAGRPAH